jgi:hypothetical protein
MGGAGGALIVVGLVGAAFAYFGMSVSVETVGAYGLPGQVLNIGLLSNREMVFSASGIAALAGVILVAASRIVEAVEKAKG